MCAHFCPHLLEMGENILNVQKRLGHVRLTTTMVYLHVADMEPHSLTWHSAGPVPLAGMSRCAPSAGICISAITAVVTDIITIPQGIRKQARSHDHGH